jgi:CheY-like chemotaxis protein
LKSAENKKKVLLVEDDLINQFAVERFIRSEYDVICTDNSEDALRLIDSREIDLILMDISIKGNMDGLELTGKIKTIEEKKNIPVIALTAYAFPQDRLNCIKAGCDEYLAKPYSKKELLNKIREFLNPALIRKIE